MDRHYLPALGLFDSFFDWDKQFYNFTRDEKDMYPYDIVKTKNALIITHNVLGLEKKDLKLTKRTENGQHYIVISGTTKNELTNKTYSVNSRFLYNPEEIDVSKISSELRNGILYITIPYKAKEKYGETSVEIEIK